MTTRRPGLFPEPEPSIPDLSDALADPFHRLRPGQQATWTPVRASTVDCQECAHLQHERRGAFGPRRQAKWRRKTPDGTRMDLCRGHALAWRTRDHTDTTPPNP